MSESLKERALRIREYVCANIFDGCDQGLSSFPTGTFLDELSRLLAEREYEMAEEGEPVGEVGHYGGIRSYGAMSALPEGTKLYASPPSDALDARKARRYDWLKAEDRKRMPRATISWRQAYGQPGANFPCKLSDGDDLDALIDAAMEKSHE